MIHKFITKIVGSRNDRILKELGKQVTKINALEPKMQALSDTALRAKTAEFKKRLSEGASLDDLLIEAFAVVREASVRTLGMRHFDVQLLGGMVLHSGKIAEMKTGEGKTLVATLPLYLNALSDKGAHLVTVNDYLVKRDATTMGKLYEFLGMSTGIIVPGLDTPTRRAAYASDITYGTNNEFGFDYLRDNMVIDINERVQRGLNFAVADEVDSILIDEARTPLIISGVVEDSSQLYIELNKLIPQLKKRLKEDSEGDYYLDEKQKQAYLTEAGHEHLEQLLLKAGLLKTGESLYSPKNLSLMHYFNAILRANTLYHRDVDYIVKDNEIVIIDPHTGRAMAGRRWSDGLHQAVEAKENVNIQAENQTLASITFQNYFRLYHKLSGMTGTADTEAYEFQQIYDLEVVIIPTNKAMIRKDEADVVYLGTEDKFKAIIDDIKECQKRKQPVLVGTASIETSEHLSELLKKEKIPHEVLNAKQHTREALIVAQAGQPGAVTIATNMAGRGTDIILGGNYQVEIDTLEAPAPAQIEAIKKTWQQHHEEVRKAGGLRIIGSERHESRRIDNQLRGRSGRQGDPGSSRFYLSLQDNLIRIFSGDRLANMMRKLGMGKNDAVQSSLVSKSIANAQKKVETHNFDIRKQLLQFDNVINDQRKVIYEQRSHLLTEENVADVVHTLYQDIFTELLNTYIPMGSLEEQWNIKDLTALLTSDFNLTAPIKKWLDKENNLTEEKLKARINDLAWEAYTSKTKIAEPKALAHYERLIILNTLDTHWREHLSRLDHLRQSINLRGYAQKDPKQEYKREAFNLFAHMLDRFKYDVVSALARLQIKTSDETAAAQTTAPVLNLNYQHQELDGLGNAIKDVQKQRESSLRTPIDVSKVGRNDPCPCGSGEKFKHCHGKLT
jgi:preprotein translocase subunit SecA